MPTDGAVALSYRLDLIGPLAHTVSDCSAADAVMAGEEFRRLEPAPLAGLRLGMPQPLLRDLDDTVAARFSAASVAMVKSDSRLSDEQLTLLDDMAAAIRSTGALTGGLAAVEGYAIHRDLLATRSQDYDPFVRARLEQGRAASAADYIALTRERDRLVRAMDARLTVSTRSCSRPPQLLRRRFPRSQRSKPSWPNKRRSCATQAGSIFSTSAPFRCLCRVRAVCRSD